MVWGMKRLLFLLSVQCNFSILRVQYIFNRMRKLDEVGVFATNSPVAFTESLWFAVGTFKCVSFHGRRSSKPTGFKYRPPLNNRPSAPKRKRDKLVFQQPSIFSGAFEKRYFPGFGYQKSMFFFLKKMRHFPWASLGLTLQHLVLAKIQLFPWLPTVLLEILKS